MSEKMTPHQFKLWTAKKRAAAKNYYEYSLVASYWKDELERLEKRLANVEIIPGPENTREEVTGLGGKRGGRKNMGNSGFSGGSSVRLAAA